MAKTALITGANKGIGFEIARQLGQKGFQLLVTARNRDRGETATQQLLQEGYAASFIQLDVGDAQSRQKALNEIQEAGHSLEVLINNAAILLDGSDSLLSMTEAEIEATFAVNSLGLLFTTRTFLPLLRQGSRVVNVSSGAGAICNGMGEWAPIYSISKTTVNAISIQLARSLSSRGIMVNAVCPGWVKTDMGGSGATRDVAKGAETPVWLATDPDFTETGKFFRDKQVIPF